MKLRQNQIVYSFPKKIFTFLFIFSFFSLNLYAQLTVEEESLERLVKVTMINGEVYKGYLVRDDEVAVILKTNIGHITLPPESVKSVKPAFFLDNKEYPNLHIDRYFLLPTARPIEKGKGSYYNALISINEFNYGLTNNLSIGGGINFFIGGIPTWYVNPRYGIELSDKSYVSIGAIVLFVSGVDFNYIPFTSITIGRKESNVSFAFGYRTLLSGEDEYSVLGFSGMHRLGKRISFISENYFSSFTSDDPIIIVVQGIRWFKNKNAIDFGLYNFYRLGSRDFAVFPHFGYSRIF